MAAAPLTGICVSRPLDFTKIMPLDFVTVAWAATLLHFQVEQPLHRGDKDAVMGHSKVVCWATPVNQRVVIPVRHAESGRPVAHGDATYVEEATKAKLDSPKRFGLGSS